MTVALHTVTFRSIFQPPLEEAGEGHLQPVERSNGASPGRDPLLGRSIKDPPRMYSDWMFIIRRVTGKKKQRTKGSSGPKLSEGKREQILLPHDMLIRKTTILKVLIQLGNVKSSGWEFVSISVGKANNPCCHLRFYWWHIIIMRAPSSSEQSLVNIPWLTNFQNSITTLPPASNVS